MVAFLAGGLALSHGARSNASAAETAAPPSKPASAPIAGGPPLRAMSLDQALAYARAHQPALRSAQARVAAAAADTGIARAQWFPRMGLTAQVFEGTTNNTTASYIGAPAVDLPRIGGTRVTPTGGLGPSTSTLAAVGVQQELFDFGRIAAQAALSDLAYEGERLRADAERLRLDLLVREAYYGVQAARAVLVAAQDAYHRASLHRDLAAAEVKSGLHAPIELTRAQADLSRFNVGQIRAGGSLRTSQAVFAAAVGVEDRLLDAAGQPPPIGTVPSLEQGLRRAAEREPQLLEARTRIRAAQALASAIAAEARPDLLLTASFSGRAGTATPTSGSVSDTYGPLPLVPNWDLGLVLRWPFHDPVVAARRSAAESRIEVARADVARLSQQETAAIQEAYVSLEVNQAAVVGLDEAVGAARDNYAQAEARFKAGLGTALELADAEAVRTGAEIQLAVGQFEAQRARAAIARLTAEDP